MPKRKFSSVRMTPRTLSVYKRAKWVPRGVRTYAARSSLPETKYFDTGINVAVTSGSADWTASEVPCDNFVNSSGTAAAYTDSCLVPTAVGSGYGQVIANRYKLKHIRLRGDITRAVDNDSGTMQNGTAIRIMLVMDTQPNGLQAQGEDVMQDVGAGETIYSYQRIADAGNRFRVLKDKIIQMDNIVAGTDGSNTNSLGFRRASFRFQWKPKVPLAVNIKSGNATPTIAGAINCNIFLLLMTGGQAITIKAATRAYYCE